MAIRYYLCIDLISFYASVECVERGLDPLSTRLVVADLKRGKGAICLAVSKALKVCGIKNRCRLYEIPDTISYIVAPPQMKKYIRYSAEIYAIYLRYVAPSDLHPYSIDEVFLDITDYLLLYQTTPFHLARAFQKKIMDELGLPSTVGIGTNLYLSKISLDLLAKKAVNGMAYLDEEGYRKYLWDYLPLSDFWQIANGIEKRLHRMGIETMRQLANSDPHDLKKEFGVVSEMLLDHAWGKEPIGIADIKAYKIHSRNLSRSQVLAENYDYEHGFLIVKEMVESLCLELQQEHLITSAIRLKIGYAKPYPEVAASKTMAVCTNTYNSIIPYFEDLYRRIVDPLYPIRKVGISFCRITHETFERLDLFTSYEAVIKERKLGQTIARLKLKYGKNSLLKAMDLEEGATTRKRNHLIGGHQAEEEKRSN